MVNSSDFIIRLKKIMEYYQLTASNFADAIEVQRSSISHILSGRNKPSLDFVLKITHKFNDVDLYWLLNGTGNFPKSKDLFTTSSSSTVKNSNNPSKKIQRIVVFYTDGTFDEYNKD